MGNVRAPLDFAASLTGGTPNVRSPLVFTDALTGGAPNVRVPLMVAEPLTGGNPNVRCALIFVQALIPVPEELPVATAVFPTLKGLTWDISKNPEFNTAVRSATSGRETRTSYRAFPIWHFELAYDWLPDYVSASGYQQTDYRTLQDFFLARQGKFGAFLFQDRDDYHVVGGEVATADGVTLQWPFARLFGAEFLEPVGQVDLSTLATFASSAVNATTDAINVPSHGLATGQGPLWISNNGGAPPTGLAVSTAYWAIAVDADHFKLATSKANALGGTAIDITAAGSGTDTLTKGVAVYDNGVLQGPAAWTLTLPNQLVFASAPLAGHAITADFDFYYVCRFEDDVTELKQFASKFWSLEKINFQSVIQ